MNLPKEFEWVLEQTSSCLLSTAIKYYGVEEIPGEESNELIIKWAKSTGKTWYDKDSLHWCGIFISYVVQECGYIIPEQSNRALSWIAWGEEIKEPVPGDILIFKYKGIRGHIGLFIEEEGEYYWVLGGNQRKGQKDSVNIKRIKKSKCVYICRPTKIEQNEISKDQESS